MKQERSAPEGGELRHDKVLLLALPEADEVEDNLGPVLGHEIPASIYLAVIGAYAWMLLVAWVAFGRAREVDALIGASFLIFGIFLGLAAIAFSVAWKRARHAATTSSVLLETWTGPLRLEDAWTQILVIPVSLALGATMLGIVYRVVT
ncbi:MAG: hypothetical protein R3D44_17555 [Hyphomicrobiaceae bacterium]